MQSAGTAEAEQRIVPWIVSALHGNHAQRARHVFVGEADNAPRRFEPRAAEVPGQPVQHGLGPALVQRQVAPEQRVGGYAPEHDVGVGHRRALAAQAVTGRPRLRPGRLRPHDQ